MAFEIVVKGVNGRGDQVFRGETAEEVAKKMGEAQEHASNKIAEQDEELKSLRQQAVAVADPEPVTVGNGEFDRKKYLDMLAIDPAGANDYWFEHRFKAKPADVAADYGMVRNASLTSLTSQINAEFAKGHPELLTVPKGDDEHNFKTIAGIVWDNKWAYTKDSLDAAFLLAKSKNQLKLPAENGATSTTTATVTVTSDPPPTVITSTSSQAPSVSDEEDKFLKTAPLDKVREYLEKKHSTARGASA